VEASVHSIIRFRRPRAAAFPALLLGLTLLTAATACDERNTLPTVPAITAPTAPQKTVVGANVIVLPTLGGSATVAYDINDAGQVVGLSYTAGDDAYHAFLWTPGQGIQDLGTLGGSTSIASAINEAGQVVGESATASGRRAFLWTPGQGMQDLGTLGGVYSVATDINDAGQVVGYTGWADRQVFKESAFIWAPGQGMQDIGSLGGVFTRAEAINNAGQVVGESQTRRTYHAFLWTAGAGMQDLGVFPGPDGMATLAADINDAGRVVGSGNVDVWGLPEHAFLWTQAAGLQDLGTLPSGSSSSGATGINDVGQVVGGTAVPDGRGFIWTLASGLEDLYLAAGMSATAAINNRGQVVGGNRVATLQFEAANRAPLGVTGAGFYAVPGSGTRNAHFTFAAKFLPGRPTVPNGTARFWIPGGQVDFESTAIEMLVVVGNRGQFWGTGTLNGAAARFRITAVDGRAAGADGSVDAFRIELWRAGTLVFDTQPGAAPSAPVTTEIDGGSIQIHRE
jgi:probable HAF family extracellular repeat protein